jgi:hypothetical protein
VAGPGIQRDIVRKLARVLTEKERGEEALELLCAGAASGKNDEEGQKLLAEALRLAPNHPLPKATFERMEGLDGDHARLDDTLARWNPEAIAKLEKELLRPQFQRAQMGFNNNLKYKGHEYHVQTEDSGIKLPHVITHLFADGGRVIKSHKRSYAEHVDRPDVAVHVKALMKAQHMEMVLALREGRFDEVIAGRAMGGMTVLTEPPQVDVQQLATRKESAPTPAPAPVAAAPAPRAKVHLRLRVKRSKYGGPELYEPPGEEVVIGSKGSVPLAGEKFCHPTEGVFRVKGGEVFLEDLEGGNGIFIRIRKPVELGVGDEFIVGDQLLRIEQNPERDDAPGPGPTYMWSSPTPLSHFRVVQILEGGSIGACRMAYGTTLQIGRKEGDLIFPDDPLVGDQHCWIEEQAGAIVLTDLGSRSGVYVRIRGEQRMLHGDEILVGRTRLAVELAS